MRSFAHVALLCLLVSQADAGEAARERVAPSLEWIRDCLVRRGVPPRYVRIEEPATETPHVGRSASRRLLFWTRTPGMSQTVLITLDDDRFISIQSSALAELPAGHPRLPDALMHMLDRNFAMAGARFARQAADGQVVLRADMRLDGRISEAEVLRAVEDLLLLADRETPRLREVIAGDRD